MGDPDLSGRARAAAIPAELLTPEETAAAAEKRVSALELFFDLVFVFTLTQVTGSVAADPTWTAFVEGLAVLAAMWFAWTGYAWLGNTAAQADGGAMRAVLLLATGAMLVCSLSVPHAFGGDALMFGLGYLAVRVLHIGAYEVLARTRHDLELSGAVGRLATTILPAALLLLLAGIVPHGPLRTGCWAAALLVDYGGLAVRGVEGWRVSAGHFAERHGAVVIIALGESIVSLGVGADRIGLSAGVVVGALLGLAVAAALWWAYFDVVAIVSERRLRRASGLDQALVARDSYSYLHLPLVAGIVVFAIGVRATLEHVGASLDVLRAVALCGGVALYLIALSALKLRNVGTLNVQRVVAALLLCCLAPVATVAPALLSLGLVALVACAMIGYEAARYAETRERVHRVGVAG